MENIKQAGPADNPAYYRMITFKLTPDLDQRLRESAKKQDLSMSEVIRRSLSVAFTEGKAIEL